MKKLTPVITTTAPSVRDALWIKPVSGGFTMYILNNGKWEPVKQMDDGDTAAIIDDTVQDLVGKNTDKKSASTIYGAKAYAKDQADTLKGTADDDSTKLTLYGLKAYIDSK